MKEQHVKRNFSTVCIICLLIGLTASSFQVSAKVNGSPGPKVALDTPKKSLHINIDLEDVKMALNNITVQLKEIDWNSISKDIQASLNSIDMEKVKTDVAKSIRDIDFNKIKIDISNSIKDIDLDKIKIDINNSIKDVDFDKIEIDIKNATNELNSKDFEKKRDNRKKTYKKEIQKNKKQLKTQPKKDKVVTHEVADTVPNEHMGQRIFLTLMH